MTTIFRKGNFNKKNRQVTLTVPKKEFKRLDPSIKIDKNTLFEIRIARRKKAK